MNCPICDKPMVVFEIEEIELDHCVECKGTWLDAGEMELLLGGADKADELLDSMVADKTSGEAKRRCPICEKRMQKVMYACGDAVSITLDKCSRNDGMWFDEGELSDILNMGDSRCAGAVYEMLCGVFGQRAGDKT